MYYVSIPFCFHWILAAHQIEAGHRIVDLFVRPLKWRWSSTFAIQTCHSFSTIWCIQPGKFPEGEWFSLKSCPRRRKDNIARISRVSMSVITELRPWGLKSREHQIRHEVYAVMRLHEIFILSALQQAFVDQKILHCKPTSRISLLLLFVFKPANAIVLLSCFLKMVYWCILYAYPLFTLALTFLHTMDCFAVITLSYSTVYGGCHISVWHW